MKKIIIVILILLAVSGGAFAQRNMVYGGVGLGVGVPCIFDYEISASYEFAIIPQLSVGVSAALQMYPVAAYAIVFEKLFYGENSIKDIFGPVVEGQLHWYPFAKTFHMDLGLGYSHYLRSMHTFLVAPGLGWRLDFGEPGGFMMNLGLRVEVFTPLGNSIMETDEGDKLKPFNILTFRLGFGYRF